MSYSVKSEANVDVASVPVVSRGTDKRKLAIALPVGIAVNPLSLRDQIRRPKENDSNLYVYSHNLKHNPGSNGVLYVHADCSFVPEKRSRKLRRPRSHAESVVEKYEEILHALKTPTSTKAGLVEGLRREEQETHLLQPCHVNSRTIESKFDPEFMESLFSKDDSKRHQQDSLSVIGSLSPKRALALPNRRSKGSSPKKKAHSTEQPPSQMSTDETATSKNDTIRICTKSEPNKVTAAAAAPIDNIDFTKSVYRYTKSWRIRHRAVTKCPSEQVPLCLGDGKRAHAQPIRTMPVENLSSLSRNLIERLRPCNVVIEKMKFFARDGDYNPQFKYIDPLNHDFLKRYSQPSVKYLQPALIIMRNLIKRYGSYERFEECTGGRVLQPEEIRALVTDYVQREGFNDGEILLNLSTDILSTAVMSKTSSHGILTVKLGEIRESWIEGLLRHELSTHYVRGKNNSYQAWSARRNRAQFNLLPHNPTEEGLASLHTVLMRPEPLLFKNAILYVAVVLSATLSFKDLFKKLAEFILDPERRWEYCVRSKRGMYDTSMPGCFTKDQVYLTGSLNILRNRRRIDFEALMRCGKIAWEDVERVKGVANYERTGIPSFMKNLDYYRSRLDFIMKTNGLRDADFKKLVNSTVEGDQIDECRFDI